MNKHTKKRHKDLIMLDSRNVTLTKMINYELKQMICEKNLQNFKTMNNDYKR